MQPPVQGRGRQISERAQEDLPLRYERLSDPILARRAKEGDRRERRGRWQPLRKDGGPATDGHPSRGAAVQQLRRELRVIAPAQACVPVPKDGLVHSLCEIAAMTGMPVGTAKRYARRARSALRGRRERREGA